MNLKQAQDVLHVHKEIKWLKYVIDSLEDSGIHTTEEFKHRQEAVDSLRKVMAIRVKQLEEM